jgi:hypothetical protein
MRAADTPPHFRLRVASLVARYLHPKRAADGPPKIVVEDPTGFSIDSELAMELRDAKFRYDFLWKTSISHPEGYKREAAGLQARIAEIEKSLQCPCPSLYGNDRYHRDKERLKELSRVRASGRRLSRQEDMEEAWLTARVASWSTIPEHAARGRIDELDDRLTDLLRGRSVEPLSPREKAELLVLRTVYPGLPPDMTTPIAATFEASTRAHWEYKFRDYPHEDETANQVGILRASRIPPRGPVRA